MNTQPIGRCWNGLLVLVAALMASASLARAAGPSIGGTGDGPPIDITCIGAMAPAVVHVKVLFPKDAAGVPAGSLLDYRYEWDFGDAGSAWNDLPGWNAAHVYDRPGEYTIGLTVRGSDGKETHRQTTIRILPDNRKRVFVSADGNDASDGSSPARPVRSPGRAFHLAKDDAWVLFRNGDVFEVSAPIVLYSRGLRVGNYPRSGVSKADNDARGPAISIPGLSPRAPAAAPPAEEALPVLKKIAAPPKQENIFIVQPKAEDTLMQGLEFDSQWDLNSEFGIKKIPARAFTIGGTNFAVRWCSFRNLTDCMNTELKPTGVLVLENRFSKEIRGYCVYANGQDHVYVGNVMVHSRQEHLIRATEPGVTRVLIAYNDLSRPNKNKGCIELRMASWFTVAGNYINDGTLRVGPQEQEKGQFPQWKEYKCEWGIVQDNRLEQLFFNVRLGTYHMIFRNNVIRNEPKAGAASSVDGDWAMIVECEKPGYDDVRKIVDVRIEHNTIVNTSGKGNLLFLHGKPVNLTFKNNVYVTDGKLGPTALMLTEPSAEGLDAQNNVYPTGPNGFHRLGKDLVDKSQWTRRAKNERYGMVPVDADDNVPIDTGAGALIGHDRSERQAKKAKGS